MLHGSLLVLLQPFLDLNSYSLQHTGPKTRSVYSTTNTRNDAPPHGGNPANFGKQVLAHLYFDSSL